MLVHGKTFYSEYQISNSYSLIAQFKKVGLVLGLLMCIGHFGKYKCYTKVNEQYFWTSLID